MTGGRGHDGAMEWRLGRRPGLDGLRGCAILLVLACHLFGAARGNDRYFTLGSTGVTLFFTLSGFLITSLLLEMELTWQGLRHFYVRRARRLLPALMSLVVVLGFLELALHQRFFAVVPTLFYFANWAQLSGWDQGLMRHGWSLAVEEQFYLVWPPLLLLSRRWVPGPLALAVGGCILSMSLRFTLAGDGWRIYYGSDTQAASLLVGAVLAVLAQRGLPQLRLPWWTPLTLAALALSHDMWVGWLLVPTIVPFAAAAMIWSACADAGSLLGSSVLGYIGRRSYALYLWHYPITLIIRQIVGPSLTWGLVSVGMSFVFAEVSWRMLESPLLRRGRTASSASTDRAADGVRAR